VFQLFGRRRVGRRLTFELNWLDASASEDGSSQRRVYRAQVPEDYGYFEGHFPGYPILPGAAQLSELIMPAVRRARPELGCLRGMSRLKFLERVQPGQTVEVALSWRAAELTIAFELRRETIVCAAGRLTFTATAQP
jgi:3-hydroxymyristoyl/3-hydroxydecanoyl-(acyl carrier protein) dehydratase